jgi:hypothetical protein
MNLNREADRAAATSDVAAPGADERAAVVTQAVLAVVDLREEVVAHAATIRGAAVRMVSHRDSSSVHDTNRSPQKIANRRCRRFRCARPLDKSRWRP